MLSALYAVFTLIIMFLSVNLQSLVTLSAVMLSVKLTAVLLSVILLSVVMLSVIMLCDVMLSTETPSIEPGMASLDENDKVRWRCGRVTATEDESSQFDSPSPTITKGKRRKLFKNSIFVDYCKNSESWLQGPVL